MKLGEFAENGVGVINTAGPGAAAGLLEGGPQAGVGGQGGVGGEVGTGRALVEDAGAFGRGKGTAGFADEVDGAFKAVAVDEDLDGVTVADFADGAAGEGFGSYVANAGAGGDAGEAGIGEN